MANSPELPVQAQVEPPVGPPVDGGELVRNAGNDVDEILVQLQEGLEKAEATMSAILASIVDDNAHVLAELEAALTDMEAALANE